MPVKRYSAHARVTLTVEVAVGSGWGEKCDLAQIYRQAEDEARRHLEHCFHKDSRARIVGRAKIDAIIAERDER
jgi:hypothetical protein